MAWHGMVCHAMAWCGPAVLGPRNGSVSSSGLHEKLREQLREKLRKELREKLVGLREKLREKLRGKLREKLRGKLREHFTSGLTACSLFGVNSFKS